MSPDQRATFQTFDGTRLAYQLHGNPRSKEWVVLVNGLMCTESYYLFLLRDLAPDYRLVTFDLRGHGLSDPPTDPERVSIADCAHDVDCLMAHLGIKRAHLGGLSLGVQIILETWARYPQRIHSLMAFVGPYENPLSTIYNLNIPPGVWERLLGAAVNGTPRLSRKLYHGAFYLPFTHELAWLLGATRAERQLMVPFYVHQRQVDVSTGFRLALAAVHHSARQVLPTISVPTLVIAGEKDMFAPVRLSRVMRDEIPGVTYVEAPQGTHTLLLEQPQLIHRSVRQFLTAHPMPAPAE